MENKAKEISDYKISQVQDLLGWIKGLFKEQSAVYKAAAVTETVINTIKVKCNDKSVNINTFTVQTGGIVGNSNNGSISNNTLGSGGIVGNTNDGDIKDNK